MRLHKKESDNDKEPKKKKRNGCKTEKGKRPENLIPRPFSRRRDRLPSRTRAGEILLVHIPMQTSDMPRERVFPTKRPVAHRALVVEFPDRPQELAQQVREPRQIQPRLALAGRQVVPVGRVRVFPSLARRPRVVSCRSSSRVDASSRANARTH